MAPVVVMTMADPIVLQGGPVAGWPLVMTVLMVSAAAAGLDAVGWALARVAPHGVRGMVTWCASRYVVCYR